jgi:glycosyltransferase involved in cell wall biosynthesis
LHGVDAHVLPYHPPRKERAHLLEIRRRRAAGNEEGGFLLALGTMGAATAEVGLRGLLQLPNLDGLLASQDLAIVVAGYGSDRLRADWGTPRVSFEGSVSDGRRDELMANARALLVYGVPATGALTRIPEALIAGLPVVATRHAARGAEAYLGVHIYDDVDDLAAVLREGLPPPPPPEQPLGAARRFVQCVRAAGGLAVPGSSDG